ncbi:MAG: SH3 domain-containing protein [Candidatus Omnitrophota bacterium]|jgi:tetratricopeptide (TPR) repeat protein
MSFKRMAVGILLFVFLYGVNTAFLFAQNSPQEAPGQLFEKANDLYRTAKYDEASDAYEQIARLGFVNGNLYYNLGNSYFKKGEIGKAILNYERARQFMPYDSDLKANLAHAGSLVNTNALQHSANRVLRWFDSLTQGFSINGVTVFLSLLFVCFFVLLICQIFIPVVRKYTMVMASCIVIFLLAGAFSLYRKIDYLNKGAVVIVKETQVRFEPSENATAYFTLPQGSRVEVIDVSVHWYKIKRPDYKVGWVDKTAIELIRQ